VLQICDWFQSVNIALFGVMLNALLALVRSEALTLRELLWMLTNKLNVAAVLLFVISYLNLCISLFNVSERTCTLHSFVYSLFLRAISN
jgi:TRAP-type C4-dicarboxylate transport system permease large subunit